MSGPKVVRVVTREERIENCEGLLAQLDAAIRALKADAARLNDSEGEGLARSTVRRDALLELVRTDNFDQAEVQIRQEIGFILSKRSEAIERAASAAAVARRQLSCQRHAATTLIKELERRAPEAHAELAAGLRQIANQAKVTITAESMLAKAMLALSRAAPAAHLSEEQQALARSLQATQDPGIGGNGWQSLAAQDKRIVDLQHQLAQIEVLKGSEVTIAFSQRLDAVELEADGPVRNMKLDALVIEVAAAVAGLRRLSGLVETAQAALAEIEVLGSLTELASVRKALEAAIADQNEMRLTQVTADAIQAVGLVRAARAAMSRREAILAGLATLGYQVNDNMATAWVDEGRVVLRKADADTHGLEIASAPDAQRLQVRTVAFSSGLAAAANLAAETAWCGDFSRLQEQLRQDASDLAIERALPVGAVPLKVVQEPAAVQERAAAAHTLKTNQVR
ncbi:hypothetical protein P245_23065 [Comamonas thiooxydans]|uniref:Uncharacterized protein n=1 Tax=Comamonas thiooxydans TaxID=363952 RepID=A0A0E3BAS3_9BURK|nr:hypothetical protein [Comamonas thiooxydans]KGG84748.1 hypothetical protein P245_23065 [Comamonas thiooxydans]